MNSFSKYFGRKRRDEVEFPLIKGAIKFKVTFSRKLTWILDTYLDNILNQVPVGIAGTGTGLYNLTNYNIF